MNWATLPVALQNQNRWPSKEVRVVLNYNSGLNPGYEIIEKNIIRSKLSKPMPRYPNFATAYERTHATKGLAH